MRPLARFLFACIVIPSLGSLALAADAPAKPSLQQALANLKIPPPWFQTTQVKWDMNKPWKEGRIEIRRLLGGSAEEIRQGVKITWLYREKKDIGDGHEWPMYLFMSGNYDWAVAEYPKFIEARQGKAESNAYIALASCYAHYGEYDRALEVLDQGQQALPEGVWRPVHEGDIHSRRGDLLAEMGRVEEAKASYAEALRLYPTSKQPYGRHVTQRKIVKIQTKLNLLTFESLKDAKLTDGTFTGKSLGYTDRPDMAIAVTIRAGRIADIKVTHTEKIELNSTTIIPARIIAKQSLNVDNVTGATVTTQAIIDGAYQALKQAGLK